MQGLDLNQRPSGYEPAPRFLSISQLGRLACILRGKLRVLSSTALEVTDNAYVGAGFVVGPDTVPSFKSFRT